MSNLFNPEHKAVSDKYREGYDLINWDKDDPDRPSIGWYSIPIVRFDPEQVIRVSNES